MSHRRDRQLATAEEAIGRIETGSTVVCGGFVGAAHPEALTAEIERRFQRSGEPRDLTLVYGAGQGDGKSRGLNHLAHEGLVRRVIGGHWGLAPAMGKLAIENKIEAWNFPQGVVCQLMRDIAAGRPGCITHVGLGTFIDPDKHGGKLNECSTDDLVEKIVLADRPWLFYKAFPVHVGLIRATTADPAGNLSMEEEAIFGEVLPIAQAVRNCGGIVIAQVKRLSDEPLHPQHVRVPGILVDHIVVAKEGQHDQTFDESMNEAFCTPAASPGDAGRFDPLPPSARRLIAARACEELQPGHIANLGIGIPEGVGSIAAERGILDQVTLTVESGPIGGVPAGGLSFGASYHPEAVIDQPAQFDFYDGGGLDFSALGCAQVDQHGNVNVSRFGNRLAGVGGFVTISQNAKNLVFCGTFTSGGLTTSVENGQLRIITEGRTRKFVSDVDQVSFSALHARSEERSIHVVTERAVFRLTPEGLELTEIAPGIDLQTHILSLMDFEPIINEVLPMPAHLFES